MWPAMSQLCTTTDFVSTCGCSAPRPPAPPPPQNPTMYYDITRGGSPTAQGIVPPNASLPATIFESNGAGPGYVWNPKTGTWN